MKLGEQVGLGPGDIVFDGNPARLPQRGTARHFRPMSVVAKRLDGLRFMMPLGMEAGLGPGDCGTVLDANRPPPLQKGGRDPQWQFSPMSLVAKRLDGSRWHLACR